jgi:TPP-dependent pyruvate/acetoin dehydrogenase alpha subunit
VKAVGVRHARDPHRRHGRGRRAREAPQAAPWNLVRAAAVPMFLECRTYRFRAHSMFDPELYRAKAEVEAWKARGPIHASRRA